MANTKELNKWNKAIWQYLIDHSSATNTGKYRVSMTINDQKTFFQRVKARYRGEFTRTDLKEEEAKLNKEIEKFQNYERARNRMATIDSLLSESNVFDKTLFRLARLIINLKKWRGKKLILKKNIKQKNI